MAWLKRNLFLVIGGVVALALLGLAGWYLNGRIQQDQQISEELNTQTEAFKQLLARKVHPGNDKVNNIELAKEDQKKLQQMADELRKHLVAPELPPNLGNREFRALLDNTITGLQKQAEKSGINLPSKDYWFTFAAQKSAVQFKALEQIAYQLEDVKAICGVLFDARVHSMSGLKRVSMSEDDGGVTDYLFDKHAVTNQYAITTPYEVSFQGFSSELTHVMEGLVNSPRCFIVKNVGVDKAPDSASKKDAPPPPMFSPYPMNPYRNPYSMGGMRGGMDPRYGPMMGGPMMQPQIVARPVTRPGVTNVLDENKLKITMQIDSVRLVQTTPVAKKKTGP